MTALSEALKIAGEAVDHIHCDTEQWGYFMGIFSAILTEARHGTTEPAVRLIQIETLAKMGNYLANDWDEFTARRISEMEAALDVIEGAETAARNAGGAK